MATHVAHLIARFPSETGFNEDTTEITANVGFDAAPSLGDLDECALQFSRFFSIIPATDTDAVGEFFGETVDRAASAASVLVYVTDDLSGASPLGSPVTSLSFTVPASTGGGGMPSEVAVVLSYNADLTNVPVSQFDPGPPAVTTRPQARRRGRMYIGPLNDDAGAGDANGLFRVALHFRQVVTEAADEFLLGEIAANTAGFWGVWSKADAEVWSVVEGYMDNAWDTQRRRGIEATERTTFT